MSSPRWHRYPSSTHVQYMFKLTSQANKNMNSIHIHICLWVNVYVYSPNESFKGADIEYEQNSYSIGRPDLRLA